MNSPRPLWTGPVFCNTCYYHYSNLPSLMHCSSPGTHIYSVMACPKLMIRDMRADSLTLHVLLVALKISVGPVCTFAIPTSHPRMGHRRLPPRPACYFH